MLKSTLTYILWWKVLSTFSMLLWWLLTWQLRHQLWKPCTSTFRIKAMGFWPIASVYQKLGVRTGWWVLNLDYLINCFSHTQVQTMLCTEMKFGMSIKSWAISPYWLVLHHCQIPYDIKGFATNSDTLQLHRTIKFSWCLQRKPLLICNLSTLPA